MTRPAARSTATTASAPAAAAAPAAIWPAAPPRRSSSSSGWPLPTGGGSGSCSRLADLPPTRVRAGAQASGMRSRAHVVRPLLVPVTGPGQGARAIHEPDSDGQHDRAGAPPLSIGSDPGPQARVLRRGGGRVRLEIEAGARLLAEVERDAPEPAPARHQELDPLSRAVA